MAKLVILLAGMPGAGKSVVSSLAKDMGIAVVSMGDIVREETERRGLEPSMTNMLRVADELRRIYGPHAIALLTLEKLRNISTCIAMVDGVRSIEEVEYFKQNLNCEVMILAIHASPRTRFERLIKRGRPDDPKSWDEFRKRDMKELTWGLGSVIALADIMVVNEGRLEEFISTVRNILRQVLRKWCT